MNAINSPRQLQCPSAGCFGNFCADWNRINKWALCRKIQLDRYCRNGGARRAKRPPRAGLTTCNFSTLNTIIRSGHDGLLNGQRKSQLQRIIFKADILWFFPQQLQLLQKPAACLIYVCSSSIGNDKPGNHCSRNQWKPKSKSRRIFCSGSSSTREKEFNQVFKQLDTIEQLTILMV